MSGRNDFARPLSTSFSNFCRMLRNEDALRNAKSRSLLQIPSSHLEVTKVHFVDWIEPSSRDQNHPRALSSNNSHPSPSKNTFAKFLNRSLRPRSTQSQQSVANLDVSVFHENSMQFPTFGFAQYVVQDQSLHHFAQRHAKSTQNLLLRLAYCPNPSLLLVRRNETRKNNHYVSFGGRRRGLTKAG